MKIKIYRKHSGLFYVFIERNDGWYRSYYRSFANPNLVFHKLKKKKLSIKFITKLFRPSDTKYNELAVDSYIKRCIETGFNMTHIVSYEIKKVERK